ncbi:hypothetical protein [Nocardiopsis gilva]|uniref:hypothetical protein n=1 Tax=Nocardiopsis gilva TaxID=280236 RepID=UPI000348A89A|nr:hypothetical protein [Nocardiopsis gilva]
MSILVQALGIALMAAFSWFVWPPLPLLVVGATLVVAVEARDLARRRRAGGGERS